MVRFVCFIRIQRSRRRIHWLFVTPFGRCVGDEIRSSSGKIHAHKSDLSPGQ